jgi:uncharacterized protein involved in exopolysaccharide biosynthesis
LTFKELQDLSKNKLGIIRLADIARELGVTPQVVSNWKSRDQVPYKYLKKFKKKIKSFDQEKVDKDFSSIVSDKSTINVLYPQAAAKDSEGEYPLYEQIISIISKLLGSLYFILSFGFFAGLLGFIYLYFFVSPLYISQTTILPYGSGSGSEVGGLASQFGLSVGSGETDFSSAKLYPEILKSRSLSKKLLSRKFDTDKYGKQKSLLTIISNGKTKSSQSGKDSLIYKAVTRLSKNIIKIKPMKSSLISITTKTFEPKLASDLAKAVIEELDQMQKSYRLSRHKEKRYFIKNRMKDVEKELVVSENLLKSFRESNRNFNSSPSLLLEEARLEREVTIQMQVFITLKKEFELNQIEEIENSSMLVVIDEPETPIGKNSPHIKRGVYLYTFIGLIFGILIIAIKDSIMSIWKKEFRSILFKKNN